MMEPPLPSSHTSTVSTLATQPTYDFLAGGGQLGRLMRAHDWAATPLSTPDTWPQSLRTSVSTCLNCAFPILIWWGPELVKLYNDAYRRILGVKHPTALGSPGRDVWPEIWDVVGPMLGRVFLGEAVPAEDLLLMLERHGYPEECYFSFSYSPIRDESGAVGGVFCPVIETTQRVIGERRLQLQRRLAEETADLESLAEVCARAAARIVADGPRDLPFAAFYLAANETGDRRPLAAAGFDPTGNIDLVRAEGEPPWPFEEAARSGRSVLVELSARQSEVLPRGPWAQGVRHAVVAPILGGGSGPAAFMIAGLNPSRPVEEMERLADLIAGQISTATVRALAAEAERRRTEALVEIDRLKTAFFANVSHEFRTPLTLLLGPLEALIVDTPDADVALLRAELGVIHRNALRLQRLVNALLDFSSIEAGRASADFIPTDLAALTRDLASGFRSACERAGLSLTLDCPPLPAPVRVDRDMWEKIVLNLLSNAFKFTFEGGIAVTLRADGGEARLTVVDSGVGIPAAELPRVFERFHRVVGQRSRTHEGSGIGLSLVQELVRLHGGAITVASEAGHGTRFDVSLPLARDVDMPLPPRSAGPGRAHPSAAFIEEAMSWLPDGDEDEAEGTAPDRAIGAEPRARVLLADDNPDMRRYARRLLSQDWDVEAVADGEAALGAALARRPDLVVADVMMPRLDGFGLLRALRATEGLADTPVILLSARAGEEARIEGLEAGADDYICKPFSAHELRARVRANLSLARMRGEVAQALERSERRLRTLLQRMPGFVAVLAGPGHRFDYVNDAFAELTGHRDYLGRSVGEVFPDIEGQGFDDILDRIYRTGEAFARRAVPLRLSGEREERFVDVLWTPMRDEAGDIVGVFVGGHDVTAHVRAETALRASEEALRLLNNQLEARVADEIKARETAQGRLVQSQRMEALGQLSGGIAHDFNNVLQAVSGGLSLIQKRAADPEAVRTIAAMASTAADRGKAITSRLLAFARRGDLQRQAVEAEPLTQSLREMLAPTLGAGIAIRLDVAAGAPPLVADKPQLETVLINLAINARDAMPSGGVLTIGWSGERAEPGGDGHPQGLAAGDYVRLDVTDTGVGMDEATLKRASEPFFTTKPVGKGTGLGLAMARGFAEQSGGAFAIASQPGRGTRVTLWFPEARDLAEPIAELPPPPAPAGMIVRALVVDDDWTVREVLAQQLEALGYAVLQAADGLDALAQIDAGVRPDLLVTDYSMPGMNGLLLIEEARRRQSDLPALLLTGFADGAVWQEVESRTDPLTLLLRKPVADDALARQAAAVLAATRP